jgi:gentisate 1,2-dioxygenase
VQEEGGEKHEIKPGDVIWTPPGVKHWHGATATTSMSHIAITNMVDGGNRNPQHYLADVLARIADHPARHIAELLPWNWQPLDATRAAA